MVFIYKFRNIYSVCIIQEKVVLGVKDATMNLKEKLPIFNKSQGIT